MRTVEQLIERVRRETRNASTGSLSAGASISDAEFVDALQDAQDLCVEGISGVYSKLFWKTTTYTIDTSVDNYEELDLPSDILMDTRIVGVEYSFDGNAKNYCNLYPRDVRERYTGAAYSRNMEGYMRVGKKIILCQFPKANSKIRLVYESAPRRIALLSDMQASLVTSTYVAPGPDWAFTYDSAGVGSLFSASVGDVVQMTDAAGTALATDAVITAVDTAVGSMTVTVSGADDVAILAHQNGGTVDEMLVVTDEESINVPDLPDVCEKFLAAYAIFSIYDRDGSKLALRAEKKFTRISQSLIQSYLAEDKDWPAIPETTY